MPASPNLNSLTNIELLQLHASIINELKNRQVIRTKNNQIGDCTEWLVAKGLALELANNSVAGYDGIDKHGSKIQIKGRRVTPDNKSRQLSAIRNLDLEDFDFLVGVVFDEHYGIIDAVIMPHEVVHGYASYRKHTNAHILQLKGRIMEDSRVKDISALLNPHNNS
jgi:hypothetical protein